MTRHSIPDGKATARCLAGNHQTNSLLWGGEPYRSTGWKHLPLSNFHPIQLRPSRERKGSGFNKLVAEPGRFRISRCLTHPNDRPICGSARTTCATRRNLERLLTPAAARDRDRSSFIYETLLQAGYRRSRPSSSLYLCIPCGTRNPSKWLCHPL